MPSPGIEFEPPDVECRFAWSRLSPPDFVVYFVVIVCATAALR